MSALRFALCALVALAALVAVAAAAEAATTVGGTISTDTTWTLAGSPYTVTSSITVAGTSGADGVTTLTIQPGVVVRFSQGTSMTIGTGSSSSPGALDARGTAQSPIWFTHNYNDDILDTRGWWGPLLFHNYADDAKSYLVNARVDSGGRSTAGIYLYYSEPTIQSTTVSYSKTQGIYVAGGNPTIVGSTIDSNVQHGIYVASGNPTIVGGSIQRNGLNGIYTSSSSAISTISDVTFWANGDRPMRVASGSAFTGNTFNGNGINEIELIGGTISLDRTWPRYLDSATGALVKYHVTGTTYVRGTDGADGVTELTIAPGTTVEFARYVQLEIGYCCNANLGGALDARGTSKLPILLTSDQPAGQKTAGWWGTLTFQNYADDALSALEYVTIEYGGYYTAGVYLNNAAPTFRNNVVQYASNQGIYVTGDAIVESSTFRNNGKHGIYISSGAPSFVGVTSAANALYGLWTNGAQASITGSLLDSNAQRPLRVSASADFSGNVYIGNGIQEIELEGATITTDKLLALEIDVRSGESLAYHVLGDLTVRGLDGEDGVTTLTIAPGVTMLMARYTDIEVGYCCNANLAGALDARGNLQQPILFTSDQTKGLQSPGWWGSIAFRRYTDGAASFVENATIEYGGYSYGGALFESAQPTFRNNLVRLNANHGAYVSSADVLLQDNRFESNTGHGVYVVNSAPVITGGTLANNGGYGLYTASGTPDVVGVTITSNAQRPLRVSPLGEFAPNAYGGNGIQEIELLGATLDVDRTLALVRDMESNAPLAYALIGHLYVRGTDGADAVTTLTIEPGVEMRMASSIQINIGYCCSASLPGALDARGTDKQPILFTSLQPEGEKTAGYWGPLEFQAYTDDAKSFLQHVRVEYGGRSTGGVSFQSAAPTVANLVLASNGNHGAYVSGDKVTLTNVDVLDSAQYGIHVASGGVDLYDVQVERSGSRPLRISPGTILSNVQVEANGIQEIEVIGGNVEQDARWALVTDRITGERLPYVVVGDIYVRGTDGADGVTTLTIDPGVSVWFDRYRSIFVAENYGNPAPTPGGIVAQGNADDPIVFTTRQAQDKLRGWWGRIEIRAGSDASSALENVTIEYGGYGSGALNVWSASPTIRNVALRENAPYAAYVGGVAPITFENVAFDANGGTYGAALWHSSGDGRLYLQDVTITNSSWRPLRMPAGTSLTNVWLADSGAPGAEVYGSTVSKDTTWPELGEPYLVQGNVQVEGTDGEDGVTTLTLEPGITIHMGRYTGFYVGSPYYATSPGALLSVGTPKLPITITSDQPADGKTAGWWSRIDFRTHADGTLSGVAHTIIEGADTALAVNTDGLVIRDNEIRLAQSYGFDGYDADGTQFLRNLVSQPTYGLWCDYCADLVMTDNVVSSTNYMGYLYDADGATIQRNVLNSTGGPFRLASASTGNLIADNSFVREDGLAPAQDDNYLASPPNRWNLSRQPGPNVIGGPMIGGNHYSDYPGVDFTNPSDGIGDNHLPHAISGLAGSTDPLPLAPQDRWTPDLKPPVSVLDLVGTLTPSGWYRGPVQANITATDDIAGIARIDYALDDGDFQLYGGPFVVADDGPHAIDHFATDNGGNVEKPQRGTFKVDASPPVVPIVLDVGTTSDMCFWLNATDAHSGVANLSWSVLNATGAIVVNDSGAPLDHVQAAPGDRPCAGLGTDGKYRVQAHAEDVAGNAGLTETDLLTLDLVPPLLEIIRPTPGEIYAGASRLASAEVPQLADLALPPGAAIVVWETEIIANATDTGTGVVRGELWVDGIPVATDEHAPFRWWWGSQTPGGLHTITVRAIDGAGRVAEESRTVLLVSDPLDRAASEQANPKAGVACNAMGAYARATHHTFTDLDVNRALALSRADLSLGIDHQVARAVGGELAPALVAGIIESQCEAEKVPVHLACGEAGAKDVAIDLTSLLIPIQLDVEALHARACADPAHGWGDAVRTRVQGIAYGQPIDHLASDEPNDVLVLANTPTSLLPDTSLAILVLNERTTDRPTPDCQRESGTALRLIVLDALNGYTTPALTLAIGSVSTLACKMPSEVAIGATPQGFGIQPGVATSALADVSGVLAGQRIPTGPVTFRFCDPTESGAQGCVGGDVVDDPVWLTQQGRAVSNATSETVGIGMYCWRADYAGDEYYLPSGASNLKLSCFRTGQPQPSLDVVSNLVGDAIVPGTPATATGTLSWPEGMPTPTGTITFTLCPPGLRRDDGQGGDPATGCIVQVIQVGSANVDGAGIALSPATTSTWAIGGYCWSATYSGDSFYLPTSAGGGPDACFATVRQPSFATLVASAATPVAPGTSVGATATIWGGGPTPTGAAKFTYCTPGERVPGEGCPEGGTFASTVGLDGAGVATSAATSDTRRVGEHCWRVDYTGDNYYLPASFTNGGPGCFRVLNPCAVAGARFGDAAASVGTRLVVGAPGFGGKGAVCVFDGATGEYERTISVAAGSAGDKFGAAIADVNGRALVGAPGVASNTGRAYLVNVATGAVDVTINNPAASAGDRFGFAVAGHGARGLIGAPGEDAGATDAGAAYRIDAAGAIIHTYANPQPGSGDAFGGSVALRSGDRAAIGAPRDDEWATDAGAVYLFDAAGAVAQTLLAPEPTASDLFGSAIAFVNDLVAIGAPGDDDGASDAGGIHLMAADGGGLERTLVSPAPTANGRFGAAVASLDGNVLAGAPGDDANKGAAYLMHRDSGALLFTFHADAPQLGAAFGASVAALGDDALVGAPEDDLFGANAGAATWVADTTAPPVTDAPASGGALASGGQFGAAIASAGGNLVIGAPSAGSGAAYLVDGASGNVLVTFAQPDADAGDKFGAAVAGASGFVAVGAPGDDEVGTDAGAAYVYAHGGTLLSTLANPNARFQDDFGAALATHGARVAVGAPGDDTGQPGSGAVYVYDASGALLLTIPNPTPSFNDRFGASIAMDANHIVVGAPGDDTRAIDAGAAYVFDAQTGALLRTLYDPTPAVADAFGASVALDGAHALVGAPSDDVGATNAGSAFRFSVASGNLAATYRRPVPNVDDQLGASIATLGGIVALGAPGDDAAAPGAGAVVVMQANTGQHVQTFLAPAAGAADAFGRALATLGGNLVVGAPLSDAWGTDKGAAFVLDAASGFATGAW